VERPVRQLGTVGGLTPEPDHGLLDDLSRLTHGVGDPHDHSPASSTASESAAAAKASSSTIRTRMPLSMVGHPGVSLG
jgi:hypothetical protein